MSTQKHTKHRRNTTHELSKEGLGLTVTRRQMLVGGLVALGAMAMPTPLLDLVPGAKPREAMAAGPKRDVANAIYEVLAYSDSNYRFIASTGGSGYESGSTFNTATYYGGSGSDLGSDRYWAFGHVSDNIQDNQFVIQNWYSLSYLRWTGDEANGGGVGVTPWVDDAHSYWYLDENNDGTVTIVGREYHDKGTPDYCIDSSGSLGSLCHMWSQEFETWDGRYGSTNANQKWWLKKANWPFDINPDGNRYGCDYSEGSRIKSFDVKAHIGDITLATRTGCSDFYINGNPISGSGSSTHANHSSEISLAPITCVEMSNVVYRDGYGYKDCSVDGGTLEKVADDGTFFKVRHTEYRACTLNINTEPIPFNLDMTFDGDQYGKTYSLGARVKSFSMKVTLDETVTYNESNLEDYDRQDGFNCIYEITNVVYRDEYVYAGCTLSAGTMISQADDGTSFKFQHTAAEDITFDIQTKAAIIYPKGPTKSVKITS